MLRNWFWKVKEEGGGPDYLFRAIFEPGDEARLIEEVRQLPLPGFVLDDIVFEEPLALSKADLRFFNDRAYQSLAEQRDSGQRKNIWVYHFISVNGHKLFIERGYGGHVGSECDAAETALLAMLAQSNEVTLTTWEVRQSGNGSGDRALAQGTSPAELLAYLQPEPPETAAT